MLSANALIPSAPKAVILSLSKDAPEGAAVWGASASFATRDGASPSDRPRAAPPPRLPARRFARRCRRRAAPFAPEAFIQSQHEPIPADDRGRADRRGGARGRGRAEIGAARPLALQSRPSLLWSGLGGLVSLAFGLWTTNLIEGLFAKAESLGMIGVAFGVAVSSSACRPHRARDHRRVAPDADRRDACGASPRPAPPTTATRRAKARRASSSRSTATARRRPAPGPRSRTPPRAIIDGRDLIDVAERALLRPLDDKAQARDRRGRQARLAGHRDQPARRSST